MIAALFQSWPQREPAKSRGAAGLGAGLIIGGAAICAVIVAIANPSGAAVESQVSRIAKAAAGGFSDDALRAATAEMDPAMLALAQRYDPSRLRPAQPFALSQMDPSIAPAGDQPAVLSLQEAQKINAAIPFSAAANPPARPFTMAGASDVDRTRAVGCLTQAIYYEAGFEPLEGAEAVAQVVINRMRHPAFPKTICGVVYQGSDRTTGCQFSFTCDGSLARTPAPAAWERARKVAVAALSGHVAAAVGGATHYHTEWVAPYWAPHLFKVRQIGAHIFYRWPGGWGLPPAFNGRYAGTEQPGIDPGGDPNRFDLDNLKLAGLEGSADAAEQAGKTSATFTLASAAPIHDATTAIEPELTAPVAIEAKAPEPAPTEPPKRPRAPPRLAIPD